MKLGKLFFGPVLAIALLVASPALAGKVDPQVEKEVKDFLELSARAYEQKDLNATMATIAPDADVVCIDDGSDRPLIGIDQIKAAYEREFAHLKAAKVKYSWVQVGAKGDVAWFAAQLIANVEIAEDKLTTVAHWTGVLEKRNGKWLLVQSHMSYPITETEEPKDKSPIEK